MAKAKARDWHKSDLKAALEKRGWTLSKLDQANDLPGGTCSFALRKPHPKGEAVVSTALGIDPQVIWPSRYDADGTRKRPQPADNYRTRPMVGHGQKEEAA